MKSPGQQKDYLAVVNEALALRAKQAPPEHEEVGREGRTPCAGHGPWSFELRSGVVLAWLGVGPAWAQAWLPPRGEASFSLGFARSYADHHINYQGDAVGPGFMEWNNAVMDLGYGITDRWAVRVGLPLVFSRYEGK